MSGSAPGLPQIEAAGRLGTPVIEFPGDHGGFLFQPEQCGRLLDQVLSQMSWPV